MIYANNWQFWVYIYLTNTYDRLNKHYHQLRLELKEIKKNWPNTPFSPKILCSCSSVLFCFCFLFLFCFYHNEGRYYTKLWRRLKMPLIRLLLSNSFIRVPKNRLLRNGIITGNTRTAPEYKKLNVDEQLTRDVVYEYSAPSGITQNSLHT